MDTQGYYYLISHHNTIVYVDVAAQCLRHAPLGTAPLNLLLEIDGERARLVMKDERSRHLRQVSIEQPSGKINEHIGNAELEYFVETFDEGVVGLRVREQYVSADLDGRVRNNRALCRAWERYLLLTMDTLDTLLLLQRYAWLSHSDRRILSLAGETIDLRYGFAFGPAQVRFAARRSCFVVHMDRDNAGVSTPIHIVDQAGIMHTFSLFRPLIYYCLFGHDSFYECLHLSLTSLTRFGCFTGALGVACDRSRDNLLKYIPKAFRDRLIGSEASKNRGWFNQYFIDHELYDTYQPILYCDVDVIFDANIMDLLIDIALRRRVCCATEDQANPQLAERLVRLWDDGTGNYFGRLLYAADPDFHDTRVALGNAGVVGFNNTALIRAVNDLVRMIASRQDPERLRIYGDQPILNYVLHKIDLGDFEILNRYCRLTRTVNEVLPAERRGMVHFYLASGMTDAFVKASVMGSYLNGLFQHVGEGESGGGDVDVDLSIPGQMAPAELDRLARLARGVPPNGCIVEVGSLFGLSSRTLAKNALTSVTVYCIDSWVREPWMSFVEQQAGQVLSFESFRNNVAGISNIIPLRGYSPRDVIGWQRTVDLVFEDSVHSNPVLHENLSFWARFVRPGGIICGHDYCDEFPDVTAEVDRLAAHFGTRAEVTGTLWSMRVPDDRAAGDVRGGA
jgi:hypothetical protein